MSCTILPNRRLGGIETGIPIDAMLTETHVSELNITLNPIENGADVADHAHIEPTELQLHAAIDQYLRSGSSSAMSPVGPAAFAADTSWYRQVDTTALTRLSAVYDSLIRLQESRTPFAIVTGLKIYKNMLIESISVSRDKDNALILEFDAVLREIKLASSSYTSQGTASVGTPAAGQPAQIGSSTVDRGQINPPALTPAQQQSFAHWLFGLRPSPNQAPSP